MNEELFTTLEIDTIGEIMNISMGSAATAASTLMDNKVTITTPIVSVVPIDKFEIPHLEPAIAVDIQYVEGISGNNILILRKDDIGTILSQMMMTELPPNFEIDNMAESAICELMNQMMGSSATVLSCFLGRTINISTPTAFPIDRLNEFKSEHFKNEQSLITIEFTISIKDVMQSQFVSVMRIDLAKEIIDVSLNFDAESSEGATAMTDNPVAAVESAVPPSQAATQQAASPTPQTASTQDSNPPNGYPPPQPMYGYPPATGDHPPVVVRNYDYGEFSASPAAMEGQTNLDLVMGVPVVVTVELGRTKRKIKEILEFGQGTIVELDKQAGSQVDVIVNGQLIAHGDVVVVDDNFSIRITEILKNRDTLNSLI